MEVIADESSLFVIVYLHSPREKYWGILLRSSATGVWLTGVDLRTLEEWINTGVVEAGALPWLATTFFPMHRVEKITVDERTGELPSMKDMLAAKLGQDLAPILPGPLLLPDGVN